jgi:hypothetical protein
VTNPPVVVVEEALVDVLDALEDELVSEDEDPEELSPTTPEMLVTVPSDGARRTVWRRVVLASATVTWALWTWARAEFTWPERAGCPLTATWALVALSWA